jgi:hypothetical protein
MGNASVHIPTPIENAITAHKVAHHGQDTAELAALYIKQMVQEVAQNGSGPMEPRLSNGVSPSNSVTNALLTLARVCPPVKLLDIPGTHLLASLSLKLRLAMSRKSIWHELRQYKEFRNFAGLVTIVYLIDRDPNDYGPAELIQLIMAELGIFPPPSQTELRHLVRQLKSQYLTKHIYYWTPFKDDAQSHPLQFRPDNLRADAPKLLARMFYAANARKFFVYCGPWVRWFRWLSWIVELRVLIIDTNFDHSTLELQANGVEHWASQIQVFIIPESQLHHYSKDNRARFSTYGDVVEHHELRDLLWRLANSG